jgi:hypothetical protein
MRDGTDYMDDPLRWEKIRAAWKEVEPLIRNRGRVDPYWFDWDFTPIERNVWTDIRSQGVPMYPQVPVGPYFLDFGDPLLRIGVEADGAAYHNVERDRRRDERLWNDHGWRVFRVSGAQTYRKQIDPWNSDEFYDRHHDPESWHRQLEHWGLTDSEGTIWALRQLFYRYQPDTSDLDVVAYNILTALRLVDFPIFGAEGGL